MAPDRDAHTGDTPPDLIDRIDAWADEWCASTDPGYAWQGRELIYEALAENARLIATVEQVTAERDAARSENDTLHEDLVRVLTQRNLALDKAAAEIIPGPDGQDDIDRQRLIQTWHEDAWDEVDDWRQIAAKGAMVIAQRDAADAVIRRFAAGFRAANGSPTWMHPSGPHRDVRMTPAEAEALARARHPQETDDG